MAPKKKQAEEMTTDEIMRRVFPPEVRKAAKQVVKELNPPKKKPKK
jgi:hypothetical protein